MSNQYWQWQSLRFFGRGIQPYTARHYDCLPAWDVSGIYSQPDEWLKHPDHHRAEAGLPGEHPNRDKRRGIFWNRHIDRRFYISYPHSAKDQPRVQSYTIGDPADEWEVVTEYRDRILSESGLKPTDNPREVAKALADSFLEESFEKKPMCTTFEENPRELTNGVEGLLHKSFCVGCARAFAMMGDMLHYNTRTIGCDGHIIAEVYLDGKWHLIENSGRHMGNGTGAFFEGSYMDTFLNPLDDFGAPMPDKYRDGLYKRINPQFHFGDGQWESAKTLRYSTHCAAAIYPGLDRYGIKAEGDTILPIIRRAGGFYWPSVHTSDHPAIEALRMKTLPNPISDVPGMRDYFFHPLSKGQSLRQSVWLDRVDDMDALEVVITFAPSRDCDYGAAAGKSLILRVGKFARSLSDLGAWPLRNGQGQTADQPLASNDSLLSKVRIPVEMLTPNAVNWIELINDTDGIYHMPCAPAVMEPYISPLWSSTDDTYGDPRKERITAATA